MTHLTVAVVALAALSVSLLLEEKKGPENLLKNGGFEKADKEGKPADWTLGVQGGAVTYKVVQDKPKEGKSCLRATGQAQFALLHAKVPIDHKKTYKLTGFARAAKGGASLKIDYFKGDEVIGQTLGWYITAPEHDWQELGATSETASFPQATHIAATIVVAGAEGGGDAQVDFDELTFVAE